MDKLPEQRRRDKLIAHGKVGCLLSKINMGTSRCKHEGTGWISHRVHGEHFENVELFRTDYFERTVRLNKENSRDYISRKDVYLNA